MLHLAQVNLTIYTLMPDGPASPVPPYFVIFTCWPTTLRLLTVLRLHNFQRPNTF